jgi:LysR family transcriptional regulator for bpeEF and oprC
MDRLDAMQLFVRVADSGSFSKAAIASGVSQSTVSKQIAAIESRLGVQLLRRTTRGLSVTEAGRQYYESILQIVEAVDTAEARVGHAQLAPTGVLRVAISAAFGRFFVLPYLPEFFALYPEVTIDLVEDGIDVAIRIGTLSDSSLIARRIGGVRYVTVGTPAYFARHGVPQHPQDVEAMPCVVFMFQGASRSWRFYENDAPLVVDAKAVVRTNDAEHIRGSVLASIGMGHSPGWLYARDIAEGRLQQVLTAYSPPSFPISAVSPAGRRQTRKAQVFTEFLADKFKAIPELSLPE